MPHDEFALELYPTGFMTSDDMSARRLRRLRNSDYLRPRIREDVSAEIVRLMSAYRTGDRSVHSAGFALKVLDAAMDKFGDNPVGWFLLQYEANDYVYGTNLAFLDDTIKFIVSGQRTIGIRAWSDMIIRNPDRQSGAASVSRGTEARRLLTQLFAGPRGRNQFFKNWIGQNEDGVIDLLWTLFILFGQSSLPMGSK